MSNNINIAIAPSSLPLRWKRADYKLLAAGITNNEPYAQVEPNNTELVQVLKQQLRTHQGIRFIWKNGYCELD